MTSTAKEDESVSKQNETIKMYWSSSNLRQPSYCPTPVELPGNNRIATTRITIAHIFAIQESDRPNISIQDSDGTIILPIDNDPNRWNLQPQQDYYVTMVVVESSPGDDETNDTREDEDDTVVCLRNVFHLFPGTTPDEQQDRIQDLSTNFYHKIWHGPDTPSDFQSKFVTKFSSADIQAFRQFNWHAEVFGASPMYSHSTNDDPSSACAAKDEGERLLGAKTMAKHPPNRMTMKYSKTWIELMKESIQEEFPDHILLQNALGTYWLHFFAMFPYSDEERKDLETLIRSP